jgi:hypothetical protein
MSRFKILFLFVGVLLTIFWLVSPVTAGEPVMQQKSFSKWIRMLPTEKRIQVETVLEQYLLCQDSNDKAGLHDPTAWTENVCRDLRSILLPEQFKEFYEIFYGNPGAQLSAPASTCVDCYSPLQDLDDAYAHLLSAESLYEKSYCDYGFYPDRVLPFIMSARANADLASQEALEAFNYCHCPSANSAKSYALAAKAKLDLAIDNTDWYCDYPNPWLNRLYMARTSLDKALSDLDDCIDQACN